jgi:hypothetical protein
MNRSLISKALLWAMPSVAMLVVACGDEGVEENVAEQALELVAPTQVSSFALLGTGQLTMQDRGRVTGGNVGIAGGAVNGPNSITTGFDCQLGVGNGVIGRRMLLNPRTAAGDLFVTQLSAAGATFTSQNPFSAPPAPPPIVSFTPGTTALTVNSGQVVTRAAGNFGQVTVNGTLRLSGGIYQFQNLDLGNDGVLQPTAPSIVRVAGRVRGGDRARLLPAAPLGASALRLIVAGTGDTNGGVVLGNDAQMAALVVSRALVRVGDRFIGSGAIAGTNITYGFDARFTFNTGFACNSNAGCDDGNPCTNDTCTDAQCLHPAVANGTSCPDDGNTCTNDRCTNGACMHPARSNGSACTLPNASGSCSGGVCDLATCNAGFGDCDVDEATGCETNVLGDESNCGQCGAACFVPNGVAACANGACTDDILECFGDFDDCDLDPENGCESNIAVDESNCGQCGAACFVNNGVAACADGACTDDILECFGGFGDCDVDPENGCETNILVDESNCGQCGAACFVDNGVAACSDGSCTDDIIQCFDDFADCDLDPVNGCETDLQTSQANCGQCGAACFLPNATTFCSAGACIDVIDQCNAGFGDCDGNPTNGCETDLAGTCNDCSCQFSHQCQSLHSDIIFAGNNVGRQVTLSGYATRPGTMVVSYVLGPQTSFNPADECDFTTADPQGNPDPAEPSHYNWRLMNLTFASSTATFPGLYPWTMNVTVIPTFEPPSEQKRWPNGGVARVAVQGIALTPGGDIIPDGHAAAFESGCVNSNNASLPLSGLVEECGSASYLTDCTFSTDPSDLTSQTAQILTLIDGDPPQSAPTGIPACPNNGPSCDGTLTNAAADGTDYSYSLGHFLWQKEPNLCATGCNYIAEADAYYAALDSDPGYGPGGRDTTTLEKWKIANGFPDGEVVAAYYNSGDIGVGREMHCRRNDVTGARACYVTNYGPAAFDANPSPDDPQIAVNNAVNALVNGSVSGKVATVAMEWVVSGLGNNPVQHIPADPVRFWVFDDDDDRVPVITLDAEGPKPVPGVCLPCHGGAETGTHQLHQPGEAKFLDQNARFLPFDTCAFEFSTQPGFTEVDQRDAFVELNAIVLDTEPFQPAQPGGGQVAPPPGSNTELLYGLYGVDHNNVTPGINPLDLLVGSAPQQVETFVPPAWASNPELYLEVVKPYCRTCHVSLHGNPPGGPGKPPLPNIIGNILGAFHVCSDTTPLRMPHASRTMDLFWGGSARAALLKSYDTGALTNGIEPGNGLACQ